MIFFLWKDFVKFNISPVSGCAIKLKVVTYSLVDGQSFDINGNSEKFALSKCKNATLALA